MQRNQQTGSVLFIFGIVFIVLGSTSNRAFLAIGIVFFMLGSFSWLR